MLKALYRLGSLRGLEVVVLVVGAVGLLSVEDDNAGEDGVLMVGSGRSGSGA